MCWVVKCVQQRRIRTKVVLIWRCAFGRSDQAFMAVIWTWPEMLTSSCAYESSRATKGSTWWFILVWLSCWLVLVLLLSGPDHLFITTQDELVKLITMKQICQNIQALILNACSCRFKKLHRNHYSHKGWVDQSGGGFSCEWRMEAADITEVEISGAENMAYVQWWGVGGGWGRIDAVENDTQTDKSILRNCQIWRVLLWCQW